MGPKKKKQPVVVDGINTTELSREQLEQFALRLKEALDREREERNFFQLERDKIRTFWEITRQQLDENRAELRNKDRQMEESEDGHQKELKMYKQKVKHLMYEHQTGLAEATADNMLSLKMSQEDLNEQEMALYKDNKAQKVQIIEENIEHQEEIRGLKMQQSEDLSKARADFEIQAREIEDKYQKRIEIQRYEMDLRHNMELTEVEERKNKQISDLMRNHEKAYTEMKNYYNDITLNNLALISSLREQMEEMKRREERLDKALKEAQKEIKNLQEPMKVASAESAELHRQLRNYAKDKICLANTQRELSTAMKELEDLNTENEVLEITVARLKEERNQFRDKFVAGVLEVQQKAGLRSVMLEKKLKALAELLEQREIQFAEVLAAVKVDPRTMAEINKNVEDLLNRKNSAIQDLEYELARVCKAHDDLLQTYEGKLEQYSIPKEELGFSPLRSNMLTAKGPAGLVTINK